MAGKKLRVGIVGVGGAGEGLLRGFVEKEGTELVAICDVRKERVKEVAERWNEPRTYTDYEKMLETEELDAIGIGTGNALHAPVGIAAAKHGIHVITEKPMAMNAKEAKAMVDAAKKAKTVMMCGLNQRFRPEAQYVRKAVDRGDLGKIYYVKTNWLRRFGFPGGWFGRKKDSGGGPLIDLGVHVIDVAHFMMGQPKPVSVCGATWDFVSRRKSSMANRMKGRPEYKGVDVEEMAVAMIRFADGSMMHVETSWAGFATDTENHKHRIIGTEGAAILEGEPRVKIWRNLDGQECTIIPDRLEPVGNKVAHFVDVVRGDAESLIPNEDGLVIQKILDAIYASAEAGKEVQIR